MFRACFNVCWGKREGESSRLTYKSRGQGGSAKDTKTKGIFFVS